MTNPEYPDVQRLFLALWPDEAVRGALVDLQKRLPPGKGRLVHGENLHITLVFLGSTPAERRQCLERGVTGINSPAFSFQLDQLGFWRKPQVLWVGSALMPDPLLNLANRLREIASRCGCAVDARPFQIHLTLLRKLGRPPREFPAMAPIPWRVSSFSLVESMTAAAGVSYKVLQTWPLPAGASGSTSE